jgi:isocitrate dehydrogenase kinase/phosphatase
VRFWQEMQSRVRGGEIVDIFPYHSSRRLHTGPSPGQGK